MHYKYVIIERKIPVENYLFYVKRFHSIDGKNYYYCGYGKDGKTRSECERWIKENSENAKKHGIIV